MRDRKIIIILTAICLAQRNSNHTLQTHTTKVRETGLLLYVPPEGFEEAEAPHHHLFTQGEEINILINSAC